MARMNITESNFLAILVERGFIPQKGVSLGGRYHVALAGLVRMGYAKLEEVIVNYSREKRYLPTPEGIKALKGTKRHESGSDARSKMDLICKTKKS